MKRQHVSNGGPFSIRPIILWLSVGHVFLTEVVKTDESRKSFTWKAPVATTVLIYKNYNQPTPWHLASNGFKSPIIFIQ